MISLARISTAMLLSLLVLAAPVFAEDWPAWRHDHQRSAVSSEKLKLPLEQVWAFRSRQSRSAPKPGNPTQAKYPWVTWYTLPISAADDAPLLEIFGASKCAAVGECEGCFSVENTVIVVLTYNNAIFACSDDFALTATCFPIVLLHLHAIFMDEDLLNGCAIGIATTSANCGS